MAETTTAASDGGAFARTNSRMIDSHVHFWRYASSEYPWMSEAQSILKRDFLPPDFLARALTVSGVIAVQARQLDEENTFLLELADAYPSLIRGVVGWVDLRAPREVLNATLATLSSHPRFVGVRHVIHDEPEDDFMLQPDFLRGISALEQYGLTYDLLLFPRHLKIAAQLVRAFPRQTFVLDHIGNPRVGDDDMDPWLTDLKELAACPNVSVKLSGMVTKCAAAWKPETFHPFIDAVVGAFGPDRCMVGSDWPVALCNSSDYSETMNVVESWLCLKPDEAVREAILSKNAERIYGLGAHATKSN